MMSSLQIAAVSLVTLGVFAGCAAETSAPASTALPTDAVASNAGCAPEASLMHVITDEAELYSFDPVTLAFVKKGVIECPDAQTISPNSMAIDRQGVAWVNYTDGTIFKVNLKDAHCEATPFQTQQGGFRKFGMAFMRNAATDGETLFVSGLGAADVPGTGGRGLAKIDTGSLSLSAVGDFTGQLAGLDAELTSSSDGKLFAFFRTNPPALAEIATDSGAIKSSEPLRELTAGLGFAFSYWGGDFWIYTSDDLGPSRLTRYRPSDKSTTVVLADVGMRIVGAGVSTCAPGATK